MQSIREQLVTLIYRYAEAIDKGDFEAIAELFSSATLSAEGYGVTAEGYDATLALFTQSTRRYDDGTPKTKHLMANVIVEGEGAVASSRSSFVVFQAVPGQLALQPIITGSYSGAFALRDGTWIFTHWHTAIELMGDLSQHLLIDLG
ncbi:MAG: nuclear transport factor 2 family protein [Actinomycetes bacterium]